jgi:hypothetical protein
MAGRGGLRSASFKKGHKANPSGRPKAIVSLVALARTHTEDAIATLADIMNNSTRDPARTAAASHILDRGCGRPAQTVNANVTHKHSLLDWSTDKLLEIVERERSSGASDAEAGDLLL